MSREVKIVVPIKNNRRNYERNRKKEDEEKPLFKWIRILVGVLLGVIFLSTVVMAVINKFKPS